METLLKDLRYGVRMLLKRPAFTAIAVVTLALGIGANTAIFSVVNAVLLKPLPYKNSEQLVRVWETFLPDGWGSVSAANLKDWREQNDVFTNIVAYQAASFNLQGNDSPERVLGATVSSNFFDTLETQPVIGRGFLSEEEQPGNHRVVIISTQLWRRNFGADPQIINKTMPLNGESFTIVGVMPVDFYFPFRNVELWVPLAFTPEQWANRGSHAYLTIARLKPGVTFEQAKEQMNGIGASLASQYSEDAGRGVRLIPLKEEMVQSSRTSLFVLLAAVGFVLLIACANVANLLLARASSRRKESAIRIALGAGRWRLIRQFLTESLILSVVGSAIGLLLAKLGIDLLLTLAATILPRTNEIGLDLPVLAFTLALSLVTGIGFGIAPALQISKTDVHETLKEGGGRAMSAAGHARLRSILVVTEVALALVMLIGAGLLIKSFAQLQQINSGLRPENVLTMRVSLPKAKYSTTQAASTFYHQVMEKVSSLPGVQAVGAINMLPLQRSGFNGDIQIEGQGPYQPGEAPLAEFRAVTPDYFRALGIPFIEGQTYNAQVTEKSPPVIIINQTLAKRAWPNESAIGKRIRIWTPDWITVTGVVGDTKQSGLADAVRSEIYFSDAQAPDTDLTQAMSLVVRGSSDPASLTSSIRREVQAVDPTQPIYSIESMESVIAASVSDRRLNMILLGIFAAVALVLAAVGIYGVLSYSVSQRSHEIGIRMAVGAQPKDILKLVVGQAMMMALIGVAIGLVAAFALTRLMASLLYGVSATDPLIFALISVALTSVALAASLVPARRAIKVDPMIALRYE
ncbi:MAG TPA: ABC transporter permease [Blastocatellia bacterium]|nr:ABC transporter permease [Blastocatellia bacterium]